MTCRTRSDVFAFQVSQAASGQSTVMIRRNRKRRRIDVAGWYVHILFEAALAEIKKLEICPNFEVFRDDELIRHETEDRADSLLELYYPINTPRSSPLTSDENTSSSSSTRQFETDTPIADSYNEPYEEPQQQNILTNRSSTQVGDDVIYFVSFTLYHGIAMNECKRLMDLIQVASGSESRVSCADLRATMERLARPFDVNQMYFCPHCYGTLSGPRGLCTSQDCRLRG
ncbi:hypothetical protein Y032_0137g2026 [Ancylostoma ceylanicum]|uniref:Uncharacterized protein n=1 Tax=Ancylostoma ceylanicum TaxID=53326 RepID=A0A016T5B6_9BILA|nr:hypothetical protein Y032_0137g2026 [Ancylostoma ceylanicum]